MTSKLLRYFALSFISCCLTSSQTVYGQAAQACGAGAAMGGLVAGAFARTPGGLVRNILVGSGSGCAAGVGIEKLVNRHRSAKAEKMQPPAFNDRMASGDAETEDPGHLVRLQGLYLPQDAYYGGMPGSAMPIGSIMGSYAGVNSGTVSVDVRGTTLRAVLDQVPKNKDYTVVDESYKDSVEYNAELTVESMSTRVNGGASGINGYYYSLQNGGARVIRHYAVSLRFVNAATNLPERQRSPIKEIEIEQIRSGSGAFYSAHIWGYGWSSFYAENPAEAAAMIALNYFFGNPAQRQKRA